MGGCASAERAQVRSLPTRPKVLKASPPMRAPPVFPPPWASAWGDDRHGLWADLKVQGVVQRMRWIEPGEFEMGSPMTGQELQYEEGPQHRVCITRGFWLADTACTQALWQAVMGSNPSHFKGDDQCPVESVSHEDVEQFLKRLQPTCEGHATVLPTEAEWEYACRAGTMTAFSFGNTVTPDQVNYNGNHPDGSGEKGLYRERTVPVKALLCNAWGLYQMHGNVDEWCMDDTRTYAALAKADVLLDPTGPEAQGPEANRAVRGGSWIDRAHFARSACRDADQRRHSSYYLGFRLALRFTSQPGPEGPAVPEAPGVGRAAGAAGSECAAGTPPRTAE